MLSASIFRVYNSVHREHVICVSKIQQAHLQSLHGQGPRVRAQDARINQPPELLAFLVILIERVVSLSRRCSLLLLHPEPSLGGGGEGFSTRWHRWINGLGGKVLEQSGIGRRGA